MRLFNSRTLLLAGPSGTEQFVLGDGGVIDNSGEIRTRGEAFYFDEDDGIFRPRFVGRASSGGIRLFSDPAFADLVYRADDPDQRIILEGGATLRGGGTVSLQANTAIVGRPGARLVNEDNTIRGSFSLANLAVVNGGTLRIGSEPGAVGVLVNSTVDNRDGVIDLANGISPTGDPYEPGVSIFGISSDSQVSGGLIRGTESRFGDDRNLPLAGLIYVGGELRDARFEDRLVLRPGAVLSGPGLS